MIPCCYNHLCWDVIVKCMASRASKIVFYYRLKFFIDDKQFFVILCGYTHTYASEVIYLADIVDKLRIFLANSFCNDLLFDIPKINAIFINSNPLFK